MKTGIKALLIFITLTTLLLQVSFSADTLLPIAVYRIKSDVLPEVFLDALTDHIESRLLGYSSYRVISRSNLDVLITEDHLVQSGVLPDNSSHRNNNSRSTVEKICTGSVSRVGMSYTLALKIIDTRTGGIDAAVQQVHNGPPEGLLGVSNKLLDKICRQTGAAQAGNSTAIHAVKKPVDSVKRSQQRKEVTTTKSLPAGDTTNRINVVATGNPGSYRRPETALKKPSKFAQKISIGAAAIFGGVAAILLISRLQ